MIAPTTLIVLAGLAHFGILIASFAAPRLLDWNHSLAPLRKFNRQVIWTHGVYLAGTILAFGLLSVFAPALLTDGTPLARFVCGFIALFWGGRLFSQCFIYDSREYMTTAPLRFGYFAMTPVFAFMTAVYCWVAVASGK